MAFSCQTKNSSENKETEIAKNESKQKQNLNTENKEVDIFCDTSKFKDFKNNLNFENNFDFQNYYEYNDLKAKEFMDNACKRDTLFCRGFTRKIEKAYSFNNEWKFLLFGYVLKQGSGMEDNSASFFIFSIYRNNEIWHSESLEDLVGEIKVELNGFETKENQVVVWGHIYPYFDPDYGKFKLEIKNGVGKYEYECHEQH